MADGPIWWPKPPGRPTGSPAPYWNLELGTMQILFSTHGCEWVNVFFWYQVTQVVLDKVPLNGLCVCVCS